MIQVQKETEEKLQQLQAETGLEESEKAKIVEQLKATDLQAEAQKRAREEKAQRLAAMEQQLLHGGVNLLDVHAKQDEQLRLAQLQLEKQAQEEQELKRMLEKQEEENLLKEEKYSSLSEEIEGKTRKLKKVWTRIQSSKQEIEDLQTEFQREREDVTDTIRDLTQQLKLKVLVISRFVPPEDLAEIEKRAYWDEEANDWRLRNAHCAGNNARAQGSRVGENGGVNEDGHTAEPIFGGTTAHWDNIYFSYTGGKNYAESGRVSKQKSQRPGSARSRHGSASAEQQDYPKARGFARPSSRAGRV